MQQRQRKTVLVFHMQLNMAQNRVGKATPALPTFHTSCHAPEYEPVTIYSMLHFRLVGIVCT